MIKRKLMKMIYSILCKSVCDYFEMSIKKCDHVPQAVSKSSARSEYPRQINHDPNNCGRMDSGLGRVINT